MLQIVYSVTVGGFLDSDCVLNCLLAEFKIEVVFVSCEIKIKFESRRRKKVCGMNPFVYADLQESFFILWLLDFYN